MHVVRFNPTVPSVVNAASLPKPAKKYLPEWFKSAGEDEETKKNLRSCAPFLDSMSFGYIQESWQDIFVERANGINEDSQITCFSSGEHSIVSQRGKPHLPLGEEFYQKEFVLHPPWVPQLPDGWSMLYVNLLNRLDSPFYFVSGVIDTDCYTHAEEKSNFPFYIKKNFCGTIPAGTPLFQMIPIKRESWESKAQEYAGDLASSDVGSYWKTQWHKKEYK